MKKIIIIILIVVILAAGGITAYMFLKPTPKEGYTQEQLDQAANEGKEAGEAYRLYLEKLLADLQEKLDNIEIDLGGEEFEQFIEDTLAKLEEQGKDIDELTAERIVVLEEMRAGFQSDIDTFTPQLTALNTQISTLEAQNAQIIEQGGTPDTATLNSLTSFRDYIETLIARYEENIASIDTQLAALTGTEAP